LSIALRFSFVSLVAGRVTLAFRLERRPTEA
jgi:hypothetical protein